MPGRLLHQSGLVTKPPEKRLRFRLPIRLAGQPLLHRLNGLLRPELPRQQASQDNARLRPVFLVRGGSQASLPRRQSLVLRIPLKNPVERLFLKRVAQQDLFVTFTDLPIQTDLRRPLGRRAPPHERRQRQAQDPERQMRQARSSRRPRRSRIRHRRFFRIRVSG